MFTILEQLSSTPGFGGVRVANLFKSSVLCGIYLRPVPNIVSVSGLSIIDCLFGFL
jgi:hypothetical protein